MIIWYVIDFAIKIETLGGVRIITHHRAGDADLEHHDAHDDSIRSIILPRMCVRSMRSYFAISYHIIS